MYSRSLILPIVALALVGVCAVAGAEAPYEVTNLRLFSGPGDILPCVGYAINDLGQVSGHGYHDPDNDERGHPFFYDPATGHMVTLGDMDGGFDHLYGGNGYGLSNDGWVSGRNEQRSDGRYRAFYWHDDNANGVSDPGEMRDLSDPAPYTSANAWGASHAGHVVGHSSYYDSVAESSVKTGWVWKDANGNREVDAGEKTYLDVSIPSDVNEAGQVAMTDSYHARRWTDLNSNSIVDEGEVATVPNITSGNRTSARGITAIGQLCGSMRNNWDKYQGFLWTDGDHDNVAQEDEIVTFGHQFYTTWVREQNDVGQLVGGTYAFYTPEDGQRKAFVWNEIKGLRDLNELIHYEEPGMGDFYISQAEGINNEGQILAEGHFSNVPAGRGDDFAVVLTGPVVRVCQTFYRGQYVTDDLGWLIGNADADTTVDVFDDNDQYVLRLKDEGTTGTDAVSISQEFGLKEQFLLEFKYRFLGDGELNVLLGGQVVDTLSYTGAAQSSYEQYSQIFALSEAPGVYELMLALEGDESLCELYMDDLYVETAVKLTMYGDLNDDGFVGGEDLNIVLAAWGDTVEAGDWLAGDPSGDGLVAGEDLNAVLTNWGQRVLPSLPESVPEPATTTVLMLGLLAGTIIRRRG